MFSLIYKDFLVQKKTLVFAFLYCIFLFLVFRQDQFRESVYIMGSVAVSYLFIMGANVQDDKYRTEVIFNSLPVKKSLLVCAKYLTVLVFIATALIMAGLSGAVIKIGGILPDSLRFIETYDIIATVASVALMASCYYPLYFKFGYNLTRFVNLVLFLGAFFLPSVLIDFLGKNDSAVLVRNFMAFLNSLPHWVSGLLTVGAALLIMAVSMAISIRIYNNKEF